MLSGLIESEFFPKWGDALWVWLKSDGVNLEQVAEWLAIFLPPLSSEHRLTMMKSRYSWWKSYFPEDVVALSGVSRGFRKGLDLMNQAMALGEDVKYRYVPLSRLVSLQVPILTYCSLTLLQTQETRFQAQTILFFIFSQAHYHSLPSLLRSSLDRDLFPINRRRSMFLFESPLPLDWTHYIKRSEFVPSIRKCRWQRWCTVLSRR